MNEIVIPEIACQELVELVTSYLEGALAEEDRVRLEAHIAECDGCTNYLEQMRQTIRALGHLPAESISPEAQRELLVVFNEWKADRQAQP